MYIEYKKHFKNSNTEFKIINLKNGITAFFIFRYSENFPYPKYSIKFYDKNNTIIYQNKSNIN